MDALLRRRAMIAAGGGEPPAPPTPSGPSDLDDYVQSGLILHMDGKEKGVNAGVWTSAVGSWQFTNHGATFGTDYVSFDGVDDYLENSSFSAPASGTGTIEVVYDSDPSVYGVSLHVMFCPKASSGLCFAINASKYIIYSVSGAAKARPISTLSKASTSVNADRALQNGVALSTTTADYITGLPSTNLIGKRGGSSQAFMKGKIYAIRVYNRKLTEAEALQNLEVDNNRFNLGLTL